MLRVICLLIGYAFGAIQSAYILGRAKGIDIREHGSGNAGTTNALRVLGTKAGLLVFVLDLLKCFVAIFVTDLIFGAAHPELRYLLKVYTLAGCVLGHDYPFYLRFRGGKGVAVMAGFVFAFHWTFIPIEIIVFFVPFLLTHYVSLGSLLVYSSCVVVMIIEGQMGMYAPMSQAALFEMYIIMGALCGMAFYRHKANIQRLATGCERKTYLFKKKGSEQ